MKYKVNFTDDYFYILKSLLLKSSNMNPVFCLKKLLLHFREVLVVCYMELMLDLFYSANCQIFFR